MAMIVKSSGIFSQKIKSVLLSTGATVLCDEAMSMHTTFRIGGPADFFCIVKKSEQLIKVVKTCREYEIPFFILGGGSNILVSDAGIRGVTIKNNTKSLSIEANIVKVDSGYYMAKLAQDVSKCGLSGLEFMHTIPGTIGGGVYTNARFRHPKDFGRYDGLLGSRDRDTYVGQFVNRVYILSSSNNVIELSNQDCQFVYEGLYCSRFKHELDVIVRVHLKGLQHDSIDVIGRRLRMYSEWRSNRTIIDNDLEVSQPIDPFTGSMPNQPSEPSAGCVFFNIPNCMDYPTGRMIDLCGLKGKRIGDAQVSTQHANYIVNLGKARASDVRVLLELCKKEVFKKFGVELVEEIQLVGEW